VAEGVVRELMALGVKCARISDPRLMESVAIEIDLIRSGKFRGTLASRSVQANIFGNEV
jgi:hypothetical protein